MDARQELVDRMNQNRTIVDRMIGAARLDIPTYEEVEHDTTLTAQAALVVALGWWLGRLAVPARDAARPAASRAIRSSCHPGPGVTFLPGYNCAHELMAAEQFSRETTATAPAPAARAA